MEDQAYDVIDCPLSHDEFSSYLEAIDFTDATVIRQYEEQDEPEKIEQQLREDWANGYGMRFGGYWEEETCHVTIEANLPAQEPTVGDNPQDQYKIEATVAEESSFYDTIRRAHQLDTLL